MADPCPFESRGDFIDGAFLPPEHPSGEIAIEEPGDLDAHSGGFPFAEASVGEAVEAARAAYPYWRDASTETRAEYLLRFAEAIESEAERLADVIAREIGKPLWEARTEVSAMVRKIALTLDQGLDLVAERRVDIAPGQQGRWRAHARGVLAVLGPFNFPGHLVHGHVVPALATGNTVVIKPSEKAPATGQLYAELATRAGFPAGVVNTIQGDGAQGARLAAHGDVAGVLFTGSFGVGRRILEATLDQPWKLVVLEMGGKNGVLVCADADLDAAAHGIAFGACVTAGQRCSATSRVIVAREVAEPLIERLCSIFETVRIGHPLADDIFMGPLISAQARARHATLGDLVRDEGGEALVAGGPLEGPRRGHYTRPSLHRVRALSRESRYQTEEHFVPDVAVLAVDSLDEGIAALRATDYGLVASVFSADRATLERVWRESRLGLLNWNTSTVGASSALPFGGVGRSGNDRPAGAASTLYCTYPVASVELERPGELPRYPGFPVPE